MTVFRWIRVVLDCIYFERVNLVLGCFQLFRCILFVCLFIIVYVCMRLLFITVEGIGKKICAHFTSVVGVAQ